MRSPSHPQMGTVLGVVIALTSDAQDFPSQHKVGGVRQKEVEWGMHVHVGVGSPILLLCSLVPSALGSDIINCKR